MEEVIQKHETKLGIVSGDTVKAINYNEFVSPIIATLQNILKRLEKIEEKLNL